MSGKKLPNRVHSQESLDEIALGLSTLLGANIVKKIDYDNVNAEKQALLLENQNLPKLRVMLIKKECKLQAFAAYHRQWKPTTRAFTSRLAKLTRENLFADLTSYPKNVSINLKEAYQCYLNGLTMSAYIMLLRTIEIAVNLIYDPLHPSKVNTMGKRPNIPIMHKLNWVREERIIGGTDFAVAKAFIEARNEGVHDVYVPSERQIISAFETVINLIDKIR